MCLGGDDALALAVETRNQQRGVKMSRGTDLLIIGAGPFGLGMAAYAQHLGFDYQVVGKPMEFWKSNMPKDLVLRSECDWHLDPVGVHTVENYLQTLGLIPILDKQRIEREGRGFKEWG